MRSVGHVLRPRRVWGHQRLPVGSGTELRTLPGRPAGHGPRDLRPPPRGAAASAPRTVSGHCPALRVASAGTGRRKSCRRRFRRTWKHTHPVLEPDARGSAESVLCFASRSGGASLGRVPALGSGGSGGSASGSGEEGVDVRPPHPPRPLLPDLPATPRTPPTTC